MNKLQNIPELVHHILKYLDSESLQKTRKVNRLWKSISGEIISSCIQFEHGSILKLDMICCFPNISATLLKLWHKKTFCILPRVSYNRKNLPSYYKHFEGKWKVIRCDLEKLVIIRHENKYGLKHELWKKNIPKTLFFKKGHPRIISDKPYRKRIKKRIEMKWDLVNINSL